MENASPLPPPPVLPPPPTTCAAPAAPPQKKKRGCLIAVLVAGGVLFLGAVMLFVALAVMIGKADVALDGGSASVRKPHEELLSGSAFSADKIAVIDVKGVIMNASGGGLFGDGGVANAAVICDLLAAAGKDPRVRAVILDMDTPGGEVTASDEIHHAVQLLRRHKIPVVTCMHSLGASGGYYVAAGTDHIVANRHTFTGSVGVIMAGYNYKDLMDKIGIRAATYKSGAMKDMLSGSRSTTPQEEEYVRFLIRQTFLGFVDVVAAGRGAFSGNREAVLKMDFADGRVLSGEDAFKQKLVDQLGYFSDAVAKARQLSGCPGDLKVVRYRRSSSLAEIFLSARAEPKLKLEAPFGIGAVTMSPGRAYYLLPACAP